MACVALTSLMGTIELEFLKPSHRVSLDDEKPLKSLFKKLSSLQDFLQKQESNGGAASIRDLEIKIRDFALKAEDGIELQLSSILLAKDGEYQDKTRWELHQTLQEVADHAEELLNIINNTSNDPEEVSSVHWLKPAALHPDNVVSGGSSLCSPNLEDQYNEDAFDAVREMLFPKTFKRSIVSIVSIVGIPGTGKTTLARRVYASVSLEYYKKAWVTMPQEYNLQHILCALLQSMTPTINNIHKGSTLSQLREELCKHLSEGKCYFIVLDNILNTQVLDDIRYCLPIFSQHGYILLTTQFYNVGRYASPSVYEMHVLDSDRSWDLFCKKLSREEQIAPKFEGIGKRVVERCEGLPRSIVTVAERLSKCNYTLQEWKKIEKEVESLGPLYNHAEHLSKLTLAYNQLPRHLKVCFLHFSIFPKRFKINVKKLIRIWIAEGFVRPLGHKALERKAYWYLNELACIGLVSISKQEHKTNVCWMHNSLHDFCIIEAKKEGLLCAVNTQQYLGLSLDMFVNSCRWLSLYSHSLDYYTFFSSNIPRSLFIFEGHFEMSASIKLLRILDFSALRIPKRVSLNLGDLVFLRYLSLPQWFDGLDYIASNNRNLQTLNVFGVDPQLRTPTRHLPSRIWESPQLRHLELGNFYTVDPPSVIKEQLETLCWVSPTHFREDLYYRFPNIKYLKIFYKVAFEPNHTLGSCRIPIIILDYLGYLLQLESLEVIVPVGSMTLLERPAVFPAQLKELKLRGTNLPMKVLGVIGQLRMLKVLKLENAFYGRVWKLFGEFLSLQFLHIEARTLEQWDAHSHHFPNLKHLFLRRCYCLEKIPCVFAYIDALQTIELELCPPSVVTSAMWIQNNRKDRYAMWKEKLLCPYRLITVVVDDGMIHD